MRLPLHLTSSVVLSCEAERKAAIIQRVDEFIFGVLTLNFELTPTSTYLNNSAHYHA